MATQADKQNIDFIPHESFKNSNPNSAINSAMKLMEEIPSGGDAPEDLPAHLRRMCESELLSRHHESELFRHLNLLKFHADQLDRNGTASHEQAEMIDALLQTATAVRDHIIRANTRLVMSIVKKFVTPQQSFDELFSDGMIKLMHAVEKFDYDRGFRFSTYAYRTISRHTYRTIVATQQEEARFTRDAEEWAFETADQRNHSTVNDQVWDQLRELAGRFLDRLDRRERLIVRCRFALGAHRKVRTFQYLADKLGISKERTRQLEKRAITKLQKMASEYQMDELISASMA